MRLPYSIAWLLAALPLIALPGRASAQTAEAPAPAAAPDTPAMPLPTKVPVPGSELYRLRLLDGSVTANDLCPVAKRPLNPKMPPVWVNGEPIGFC